MATDHSQAGTVADTADFHRLMDEMRAGSSDAAWSLLETYGPHIRAVVRKYLDRKMRMLYDSEDFVQAVWASLIRVQHNLGDVKSPENFIMTLARNKVVGEVRRRKGTMARDIRRQVSLDEPHREDSGLASRQPRPSEWVIARELWQSLINGEPELSRTVIRMRISGATYKDIAEELNINERTARRIIGRLLIKYRVLQ